MTKGLIWGKISSFDLDPDFWRIKTSQKEVALLTKTSQIIFQRLTYPKLFITKTKNQLRLSYEKEIEFILERGRLTLISGPTNTFPLYYFNSGKQLLLATSYVALLPHLSSPNLNLPFTAEYLLLAWHYSKETLLNNVFLLTERAKLLWNRKGITLELAKKNKSPQEKLIITPAEALTKFEGLLNQVIFQKLKEIKNVPFGVELSGGLDSSTLAAAIADKTKKPLEAFSMILPGNPGKIQLKRLRDFRRKYSCRLNLVRTDHLYPFKNQGKKRDCPFYPPEEIYQEALAKLAQAAGKKGIKVIFTGMGGDELFKLDPRENEGFYGKNELAERRQRKIPAFFTEKIKKAFLNQKYVLVKRPIPAVPHSALSAGLARNNYYLRQGVWPVALFTHPKLVDFCRRLPSRLQENKKLFRLYQEKKLFPDSFLTLTQKDSFYPLYELGIKKKESRYLIKLFTDSQLAKQGLVKENLLIQSYQRYLKNKGPEEHFYGLASLEIFLRSIMNKKGGENNDQRKYYPWGSHNKRAKTAQAD